MANVLCKAVAWVVYFQASTTTTHQVPKHKLWPFVRVEKNGGLDTTVLRPQYNFSLEKICRTIHIGGISATSKAL